MSAIFPSIINVTATLHMNSPTISVEPRLVAAANGSLLAPETELVAVPDCRQPQIAIYKVPGFPPASEFVTVIQKKKLADRLFFKQRIMSHVVDLVCPSSLF